MRYIKSFLFNIYFFFVSFGCALFGLFFLLGHRKTAFLVPKVWEILLSFGARWLLDLDYRVEGLENLPKGACILASKHQSAWETFTFCGIFPGAVFIAKQELRYLPLMNFHFDKQKTIFVNRKLGSLAREDMIRQAKERIADGDRIVIYPEGTRHAPGAKTKYKQGIVGLYKELNVPVVPISLNSGVYWPRRSFLKKPGTITVSILPPIQPGLTPEVFMETLHTAIETRSQELSHK